MSAFQPVALVAMMDRHPTQVVLLPGGVLPAELAYPALVEALGPEVDARYKELEIYATPDPPRGDFLAREVRGIQRFADALGFDRFHLVGYSAGGACALAFCTQYPHRLQSLTLNEPGWIGRNGSSRTEDAFVAEIARIAGLGPSDRMAAFVRQNLAPGVTPPPRPEGPPPPWMAQRTAAFPVLNETVQSSTIDHDALRAFDRPVLYTLGGLRHAYYRSLADRLGTIFRDFTLEEFPERHHFDPTHRAEPERMARALQAFWAKAEERPSTVMPI